MKYIVESYKDIFGYFDFEPVYDGIYDGLPAGGCFVEIGAFMGRSTAYFAQKLKDNKRDDLLLITVDTWKGTAGEHEQILAQFGRPLVEIFMENIDDLGLNDWVCPIEKTSHDASKDFPDKSVDVVFIDGDHSFDGVTIDIRSWLPKIKKGGLLCGHDIDRPQVWRAVNKELKGFFYNNNNCWFYYV